MGNISSKPAHANIPEAYPLDASEIHQASKELWYTLHKRAAAIDNMTDPWISQYRHIAVKKPWTLKRIASFVPGLGTALGIFGVYCGLEQLGLFYDGGWSAWTRRHH